MNDLRPRYSHPFTLQEAVHFDVSTITEGCSSRSHTSPHHTVLEEYKDDDPDVELVKAYEENKIVIEAQEERISILQQALSEKGVSSHYTGTSPSRIIQPETGNHEAARTNEEDEGIHL
ncbi:hypothetical protein EYR36_006359 [Pleurotus pulmonarius]|nr:hypothetical protein EYR36_006359 [Pleurotus pulmonarius]